MAWEETKTAEAGRLTLPLVVIFLDSSTADKFSGAICTLKSIKTTLLKLLDDSTSV